MLTVQDIKNKVVDFPDDRQVEELIDEIISLYKIKRGLDDIKNGDVISGEEFEKEMEQWLKYK
jgi:hypothetical protein